MDDEKRLQQIRKSAQMGCFGIDCVTHAAEHPALAQALAQQKAEYGEIFAQADALLKARGQRPRDIGAGAKTGSKMMAALRLRTPERDAKIAEMMVQGNTKGMIKRYRARRQCADDAQVRALSEKLLQTELHNVEQMKKFL